MSFLSAIFLWGLPLAAVPVVVHLLSRRRQDVVRWGAMQFLVEAVSRRRRIWRIEDLLLMLLRVAAVLAFVLALAQPLVRSSWLGAGGSRDVILVLDTSMSTSLTNSSTSLFEKQLARADELMDELGEGDSVRVLLASTVPQWLVPVAVGVNGDSRRAVQAQLGQLEPTLAGADMMRCLQEAVDAAAAEGAATRIVSVLTDGCAHGWQPEAAQTWRGLKDKLQARAVPGVVNVVTVGDPNRAVANLAVTSINASRGLVGAGETVALTAVVKNTGHLNTQARLVSWSQGEDPIGAVTLPALAPGEETPLSIKHAFDSPGVYDVTCRIDASDDLAMDNVGRFVIEVVDRVPILVVDGSPWARPLEAETGYLLVALGRDSPETSRAWTSVFEPEVVDAPALASQRLNEFRCVVLADVERLPEETVVQLADYVQRGGGLWMILADETDRSFFNEIMAGRGLSPLPLAEPVGDPNDDEHFVVIHPPTTPHPATRLLADTERLDIDQAKVRRRHRFDLTAAGRDVSVLLTTAQAEPLVVEKVLGRGRIIVQGLPMNLRWSNLPACQAFVVMVHEWLWYLTEPTMTQWNLNVGEALTAALPLDASGESAEVTTPQGETSAAAAQDRDGRRVYRYPHTRVPGPYKLVVQNGQAPPEVLPFHVRRDADESELSALSQTDSEALVMAAGLRFVEDPLALDGGGPRAARAEPVWTWLLAALLAMLLIESVFAGRLTRRRVARPAGLVMEGPEA